MDRDYRNRVIGSFFKIKKEPYGKAALKPESFIVTDVFVLLSLQALLANQYSDQLKQPELEYSVFFTESRSLETISQKQFIAMVSSDTYELDQSKTDLYQLKINQAAKSSAWWTEE